MTLTEKLRTLKPDQIIGLIKERIRRAHGDEFENRAEVYATRGGFIIRLTPDAGELRFTRRTLPGFFAALPKKEK